MEPKNGGLEDEIPFQRGDFQVPAVSFRGSKVFFSIAFWHNASFSFWLPARHTVDASEIR